MNPATGIHSLHSFKMNDIFDPNYSGTGHQPFGHDTYMALYGRYLVKKAVISVKFWHEGTNNLPADCGVFLNRNVTLDGSLTTKKEQVRGRGIKTLGVEPDSRVYITQRYNPYFFFAKQDAVDSHQMSGTSDASPTIGAYCTIWAQMADALSTSLKTIHADVKIIYTVLLTEPQPLSQS